MQEALTYIIVVTAVLYVLIKTMKMVRKKPSECHEESPTCRGCQLKESCKMMSAKCQ